MLAVSFNNAALFVRSFAGLATMDPGFERQQVLVADVDKNLPGALGQ